MVRGFESLAWGVALVGGCLGALLLPLLMLVLGVFLPLGWLGSPDEVFERLSLLLGLSPSIPIGLAVVHAAVFWHAAHALRLFVRDLAWRSAPLLGALAYGSALFAGVWTGRMLAAL